MNCVDCLDRTNVVQMVLAKHMLENQLAPLGILIPPAELPLELKKKFLQLWANNGDAISEQYAGTSALKGDYTRTGERNFTGIMKDGVKSANRSRGIFSLFIYLLVPTVLISYLYCFNQFSYCKKYKNQVTI